MFIQKKKKISSCCGYMIAENQGFGSNVMAECFSFLIHCDRDLGCKLFFFYLCLRLGLGNVLATAKHADGECYEN